MMRRLCISLLSVILAVVVYASVAQAASAASLQFDTASYSVVANGTFNVQVIVDPGTDQISSTDIHVTYDPLLLQPQTVTAGTYFPTVTNNIASGNVSIYATVNDSSSKTGTGTVATITFKGLQSGTGTLQFFCDLTSNATSKVVKYDQNNINAPNVINCSANGTATVSVGSGTATGTGTGGTGGTSSVGSTASSSGITQLPTTGTVENIVPIVILGMVLVTAGAVTRFL